MLAIAALLREGRGAAGEGNYSSESESGSKGRVRMEGGWGGVCVGDFGICILHTRPGGCSLIM